MSFCQSCGTALPQGATACATCGGTAAPGTASVPPVAASGGGIAPNVAGALAYFAGVITGIIFLVIEPSKNDRFVRFHAFQSIFFNVAWVGLWIAWTIIGMVLGAVTHGLFFLLQIPVDLLLGLGGLCLWLYLMYSAYQSKMLRLPVIGPLAAKQAGV